MPLLNDMEKADFLVKRGWVQTKQPHAWRWMLSPLKALYLLGDAYDYQVAVDPLKRTPKRVKAKG